jgi:hypothetical protein
MYQIGLLKVLKLRGSKKNWLSWFWIFGLTSCKSVRLDLYALFGVYLKLQRFEQMNVAFDKIQNQMDKIKVIITNLPQSQMILNLKRQEKLRL